MACDPVDGAMLDDITMSTSDYQEGQGGDMAPLMPDEPVMSLPDLGAPPAPLENTPVATGGGPVFIATARPPAPAATATPLRAASPTSTPFPGRRPVEVLARDDIFVPAHIEVQHGTLVRWVNRGVNDHDVVADDGSFASPVFRPRQTFEVVFGEPGSYAYVCTLHENMIGTVDVR